MPRSYASSALPDNTAAARGESATFDGVNAVCWAVGVARQPSQPRWPVLISVVDAVSGRSPLAFRSGERRAQPLRGGYWNSTGPHNPALHLTAAAAIMSGHR